MKHEDGLASTDEDIGRVMATLRAARLSKPATAGW